MWNTFLSHAHRRSQVGILVGVAILSVGSAAIYIGIKSSATDRTSRVASRVATTEPISQVPGGQLSQILAQAQAKLPSESTDVALIQSRRITVAAGKFTDSSLNIGQMMHSFEANALGARLNKGLAAAPSAQIGSVVDSAVASIAGSEAVYLNQAVASAVLNNMLLQYATNTHQMVSMATATARADKNYHDYLAAGSPKLTIPNGESAKATFVSHGAIELLRYALTITKMRAAIAGSQYAPHGGINNQNGPLSAWMRAHLDSTDLLVHHSPVPLTQLPDDLPPVM